MRSRRSAIAAAWSVLLFPIKLRAKIARASASIEVWWLAACRRSFYLIEASSPGPRDKVGREREQD